MRSGALRHRIIASGREGRRPLLVLGVPTPQSPLSVLPDWIASVPYDRPLNVPRQRGPFLLNQGQYRGGRRGLQSAGLAQESSQSPMSPRIEERLVGR